MEKEREPIFTDGGYSEVKSDMAIDQVVTANDQVKGGNIFDPKKIKKKKSLNGSQHQ